ncbi:hypothetical protein VF13_37485 [Nostoc linckia z16]|nr:hypothetical protein VF13_37485 [Nostoc linckia z16]
MVNIVLFLFLSFIAAPTVVSLVEDSDTDVSMFYNVNEEEVQKSLQEIKAHSGFDYQFSFIAIPLAKKSSLILSENLQRHENAFEDVFLPPPETV